MAIRLLALIEISFQIQKMLKYIYIQQDSKNSEQALAISFRNRIEYSTIQNWIPTISSSELGPIGNSKNKLDDDYNFNEIQPIFD